VTSPFARVVAVDFSAASVPTRGVNSIWVAVAELTGTIRSRNCATRAELATCLTRVVARPGRSLVAFDIALGWPAGMAASLGLVGRPHDAVQDLLDEMVVDEPSNANNRFDVAATLNARSGSALFWGHPPGRTYALLGATTAVPRELAPRPFDARRTLERHVGGSIKSPMQLSGAGALGGQSLLGQVFVRRWARHVGGVSVWPFDPPTGRVVVGEYYFSLCDWRAERGLITDDRQARAAARYLRAELAAGRHPARASLLAGLSSPERQQARDEEGWLLAYDATRGRDPRATPRGTVAPRPRGLR
jgi:hypothetical protein